LARLKNLQGDQRPIFRTFFFGGGGEFFAEFSPKFSPEKMYEKSAPDSANFRSLGNCLLLGTFLKIIQTFGLLFITVKVMYQFRQNLGGATFWAIFSQTQLAALPKAQP
jgi:hypothetical protein